MSQGHLEGLELGVPAACFGQRFCAWGAPCADVSDRLGPEGSPSWASDLDCDMRRPCMRGWVAASTASWDAAEAPASWPPLCLLDVVKEAHRCCIHLASARWPCSTSQDASWKFQTRSASKPACVLYKLAILHAAKT
ncbi:uncharacterized protein LOC144153951 isoform X5 [Haemaphysalis longicornis]